MNNEYLEKNLESFFKKFVKQIHWRFPCVSRPIMEDRAKDPCSFLMTFCLCPYVTIFVSDKHKKDRSFLQYQPPPFVVTLLFVWRAHVNVTLLLSIGQLRIGGLVTRRLHVKNWLYWALFGRLNKKVLVPDLNKMQSLQVVIYSVPHRCGGRYSVTLIVCYFNQTSSFKKRHF